MTKMSIRILAFTSFLVLSIPQISAAYNDTMIDWRAYYDPCQTLVDASCTACHQNGFDYNPYGAALKFSIDELEMTNEEAFVDVEGDDSDGDGYSNGQEIVVDCTLPGSSGSHGVVAVGDRSWSHIKALYR